MSAFTWRECADVATTILRYESTLLLTAAVPADLHQVVGGWENCTELNCFGPEENGNMQLSSL